MTTPLEFRSILTVGETRDAEHRLFATGSPSRDVMENAGTAVAAAVAAYVGPAPTLVLCGPGNNGGDGYVVARLLKARGWPVRVAATGAPTTDDARDAASAWDGPIETLDGAKSAPILIDALFGTGLTRTLDPGIAAALGRLAAAARTRIAVDVPSGIDSDHGALLGASATAFEMTVAIGCLKPAHRLYPAAALCGRVVIADIGLEATSLLADLGAPVLGAPDVQDHKYRRGYVLTIGGAMAGAAELAGQAAMAAGAGYGVVAAMGVVASGAPHALIRRDGSGGALEALLCDERIGAVIVGPGLGLDHAAFARLKTVMGSARPLVLDADVLTLMARRTWPLARRLAGKAAVLTPHEGEFERLFPGLAGSKVARARAAAKHAGAVIVLKGADTVIAAPDGRAAINNHASPWLSTAGTGDVLAGVIGAMLARGLQPFEAACAAVWLHGDASLRANGPLVADDLLRLLPVSLAACVR